jgi:transmembrane sensor
VKEPEIPIDKILTKWLTNTACPEELQILKIWASQDEANLEVMETLKSVWSEKTPEPILVNVDEKISEIWEKGRMEKTKKWQGKNRILKYAAAIFLLIGSSFGIYFFSQTNKTALDEMTVMVPSYVLKESKPGQKTKFSLPDGSVAYLNSSSRIKYLSDFFGNERRVILEGEAFFEVAKDKMKPFIVESRTVETVALGTSFNVNAFEDSKVIRVSLVEGEVKVNQMGNKGETIILNPGRELVVVPETRSFLEMPFNLEEVIGWKEGKLVFNHATLQEVTRKLERWYGVQIQIEGKVPKNWKVTTVYHNQTLKNVLTDLQYSKKFAYEIDESKVTITF